MLNKVTDALLHMIPAGMLLFAIGRWPYSYYMLLRVVVLAAALLLAGLIYQKAKTFTLWVWLFVIVAIVFNPVVPLHLTRGIWSLLNLGSVVIFAGHYFTELSENHSS